MPMSGATPSQNPNIRATCTERRQEGWTAPSAMAVRKLSRLRVNPRMRRLPIIDTARDRPRLTAWPIANRYQPLLLRQRECEQRASVGRAEHLGQEPLGPAAPPARREDVLPPVHTVGRRVAVVTAAALELEQQLTAVGVPCVELTGRLTAEHDVARGGQQ